MTDREAPQPAYNTKQLPILTYKVGNEIYDLLQSDTSGETGSTLWLSAQVLSEYLVATLPRYIDSSRLSSSLKRDNPTPTVLELGSGIGLTALVLQSLGYNITATDTEAICRDFLRVNVTRNTISHGSPRIKITELDWFQWERESLLDEFFDLVIASDVVYEASLIPALCNTINRTAKKGTSIYVAQEIRDPALFESFVAMLYDLGISGAQVSHLKLKKIMRDKGWEDDTWDGVVIWKFRRRSMKRS